MKSAYELAMEKLGGDATPKLTDQQKAGIAEIDNRCKAKIAETEVMSQQQIDQAGDDSAKVEQVREALSTEIRRMREKAELQKNKIRERER